MKLIIGSDLKKGQHILIKKRPISWNSYFSWEYPLAEEITYPLRGIVSNPYDPRYLNTNRHKGIGIRIGNKEYGFSGHTECYIESSINPLIKVL